MSRPAFAIGFILASLMGCQGPTTSALEGGGGGPAVETAAAQAATRPAGMVITESTSDYQETVDRLLTGLSSRGLRVVADLDHAANAERVGLSLPPTREVFFGNPRLGTPLMQSRQGAGIDLPQKMLVWQEGDAVFVGYTAPRYLKRRHALAGVDPELARIAGALRALAMEATGAEVDDRIRGLELNGVRRNAGITTVDSQFDATTTFERLVDAIESAGPLSILFTLAHDSNAQSVGLDLRPTRLVVFGNPGLGTPLMQSARTVGIDLPQKFLVVESRRGEVQILYNDPFYVAGRHGIDDRETELTTIRNALAALARRAATG